MNQYLSSNFDINYIWTEGNTTTRDIWTKWFSGFYPKALKTLWITTWGDGLKAGSEKWDDLKFDIDLNL